MRIMRPGWDKPVMRAYPADFFRREFFALSAYAASSCSGKPASAIMRIMRAAHNKAATMGRAVPLAWFHEIHLSKNITRRIRSEGHPNTDYSTCTLEGKR